MKDDIHQCVIIGSSRGLGAALVEEFLQSTSSHITGIARTSIELITNSEKWMATERYRHIQLDIGSPQCRDILHSLSQEFEHKSVCIIFNAAHIERDVNQNQSINYEAFDQVNRVGIQGLGNVLFAFESHLLTYGGILVGISSFWGSVPPLFLPWVAYPASKAYLNIAFRCLRVAWRKHAKVVFVNIGNIDEVGATSFPQWIIPTYSMAAKKILRDLVKRKNIPKVINYPLWHSIVYRYVLKFVPEIAYLLIFKLYIALKSFKI